ALLVLAALPCVWLLLRPTEPLAAELVAGTDAGQRFVAVQFLLMVAEIAGGFVWAFARRDEVPGSAGRWRAAGCFMQVSSWILVKVVPCFQPAMLPWAQRADHYMQGSLLWILHSLSLKGHLGSKRQLSSPFLRVDGTP
ncbi:unnamed protein product, partial [Polarella glacialis]